MNKLQTFFQDEKGEYSSKRLVGIIGMFIVHLCYAFRVIAYGDTTDTVILVTADTALLGVEVVTKAMINNNNGDKQFSDQQDQGVRGTEPESV